VGKGANLPVSGDQLTRALGSDKMREIASGLGMSHSDASNSLASVLPELIDKLTPEGSIPEDNMLKQGLDILTKHFMKG
jgi:uncharacterized protein YidB (DUF937 family)